MRRWVATSALAVVVAACAAGEAATTTSMPLFETTTSPPAATSSTLAATTTTTAPAPGGYLVRLDPETLQSVDKFEPVPIAANSWNFLSRDGSVLVNVECDEVAVSCHRATGVDLDSWHPWGAVDVGRHVERTADGSTFYGYDGRSGTGRGLFSVDLVSGEEVQLAEWRDSLYFWDGLHVLSGGVVAGLAPESTDVFEDRHSVYLYDPADDSMMEIPVGPLSLGTEHSGVFDGDYEIPIFDSPGVAWGDDRLFIANAEALEVTEVDLATGSVDTHQIDASSWLDRLLAFWMPTASAKGPSLGTYSSAALSPDDRYLFVSGNRSVVETSAGGTLVEVQEHLGLRVIDTESWRVLPSPDLNIQFVRNAGHLVFGVETTSTEVWTEEYYVLEVDTAGDLVVRGPIPLADGWCDATADSERLLCMGRGVASSTTSRRPARSRRSRWVRGTSCTG